MKKYIFFAVCFLFVSCSSVKGFKGKADFCGILTDSHNHGLAGYTVCMDGNRKYVTNDSGIFVFSSVPSQNIHVTGYKTGYEKIDCETYFYDENNFVCFKVRTKDEVIEEIELCLEEKEYLKAEELLDSIDYSEHDEKLIFLRSIIKYLQDQTKEARKLMSKIKYSDESVDLYRKLLSK